MKQMRRFKQELAQAEVFRILNEGKVAVLAVDGDEGYPYAVPVNYVYVDGCIYFHCARQGHKLDALRRNAKCSACIIEKDDIVAEEFTSYFRSVIVFGHAAVVEDHDEIIKGLELLSAKYSPGIDPTAEIAKFIKAVCIVRIDIDHATGKEAKELVQQRNAVKQ